MRWLSISVLTLLAISASGCSTLEGESASEGEIERIRAEVADTYRHYDSLCVGLPERQESTVLRDAFNYPYAECMFGQFSTGSADTGHKPSSAPGKAWKEASRFCSRIEDETLSEACESEAVWQYHDRLGSFPED